MMINLIGKKAQIACELLCCCSMAYAQSNDNSEVVVLNTGWEFSQAGTELWRPAQVPGTVHQDLINHKQLSDPCYGINKQKIQWKMELENAGLFFTVTSKQLKRDDAQLVFKALTCMPNALTEVCYRSLIAVQIQCNHIRIIL